MSPTPTPQDEQKPFFDGETLHRDTPILVPEQ